MRTLFRPLFSLPRPTCIRCVTGTPTGTLTLLLLCLGGWWWYRHRTHLLPAPLLSLRRYMAPLPGDETTLVVTDIQGSTALWEALPAAVMGETL